MKRPAGILFVALLLGVTGCDHATKYLASAHLTKGRVLGIIPGLLDLQWVANTDTAFSLLHPYLSEKTRLGMLTAVSTTVTVLVGALVAYRWRKSSTVERVAGTLLLGGGLGNVVDRFAHGHVVDFIHLHYWPVFNVADIALTIGAAMLLMVSLRRKPEAGQAAG